VARRKIHVCLKIAEMLIKNEGACVFHFVTSKQPNIVWHIKGSVCNYVASWQYMIQ